MLKPQCKICLLGYILRCVEIVTLLASQLAIQLSIRQAIQLPIQLAIYMAIELSSLVLM